MPDHLAHVLSGIADNFYKINIQVLLQDFICQNYKDSRKA